LAQKCSPPKNIDIKTGLSLSSFTIADANLGYCTDQLGARNPYVNAKIKYEGIVGDKPHKRNTANADPSEEIIMEIRRLWSESQPIKIIPSAEAAFNKDTPSVPCVELKWRDEAKIGR
jgi:hypothetical protein